MATKFTATVKETIDALKEKNPTPRKVFNKVELTKLVEAVLNDTDYVAQNTKIKKGEFVLENRELSKEFKKSLAEILKQLGLNSSEALAAVETYKVPRSLASVVIDAVHHGDYLYMNEVGKAVKFHGAGDTDQTFFIRDFQERTRRSHVPGKKGEKNENPEIKEIKIKKHRKIATKTRYNPNLKELLS